MNACIVSFFMENINPKTLGLQRSVVEKFNKSKHQYYMFKIDVPHAVGIDYFWAMNGVKTKLFEESKVEQQIDHDVVLFLDIDCIPLCEDAIDFYLDQAMNGKIVGNIQRTNHLENGQHVFAAPSACAISRETFKKIGAPPAMETARSDVAEEWTWEAEKIGIPVELYMPLRFDRAPHKYDWEKNKDPFWELADGMPVYGLGTTFGDKYGKELFWHSYQIFHPGQQEHFWAKCESILVS